MTATNTQKKIRCYDRIYDPGHSWLEVPISDVRISGVYDSITAYSPKIDDVMYLEEDCDLATFYNAMTSKGYKIIINNIDVDDFDEYLNNK